MCVSAALNFGQEHQDLGCDLVLWRIGIVNKFLEFWRGLRRVLSATVEQNGEENKNKEKF